MRNPCSAAAPHGILRPGWTMNPERCSRFAAAAVVVALLAAAERPATPAAEEMSVAASNFLKSLTPEQSAKARFELRSDERKNWHFIPRARLGLPLKEMTAPQRQLAHALISTGLSNEGSVTALTIMSMEQILADLEKDPVKRDSDKYYLSVFGTPEAAGTWGWRVEGHHLSLNYTLSGGAVFTRPSFFGGNPGEVREGPRAGTRVLARQEELARALVTSLSEEQKKTALLPGKTPEDIFAKPGGSLEEPALAAGLPSSKLSGDQQKQLTALIESYATLHRPDLAEKEMAAVRAAAPESILFAWAGGTERFQGHYYRVKGPGFLIEWVNVQNSANHPHSVWHDLKNGFGDDVLRKHFEKHP